MSGFVELKKALIEKAKLGMNVTIQPKDRRRKWDRLSDVLDLVAGLEQQLKDESHKLTLILDEAYPWYVSKPLRKIVDWHIKFEEKLLGLEEEGAGEW